MRIQCKTYKIKDAGKVTKNPNAFYPDPIVYSLNLMIGSMSGKLEDFEVMDDYEKFKDCELIEMGNGVVVDNLNTNTNPILNALHKWREKQELAASSKKLM